MMRYFRRDPDSEPRPPGRTLKRFQAMVIGSVIGAIITACFGYDFDFEQWMATLAGAYVGGMLAD